MKINNLPLEIQKRVFECQKEQGNEPNNEISLGSNRDGKNFDWSYTVEGLNFWNKINDGKYEIFFGKYPKQDFIEREMMVSNDNVTWFQSVVFDYRKERYLAWFGAKTLEDSIQITRVMPWKFAREIEDFKEVKITVEEIAKLVGCSIENLRIIQ